MHLTDIYGRLPGTRTASVHATPAAVHSNLPPSSAPPIFDRFDFQPNGLLSAEALPLRVPIPSTGTDVSFSYDHMVPAHRVPLPLSALSTSASRLSGNVRSSLPRSYGGATSLYAPNSIHILSPTRVSPAVSPPSVASSRIYPTVSSVLPEFTDADSNFPSHAPSHETVGTFIFGDEVVRSVPSTGSVPQPSVHALATPFALDSRPRFSRVPSIRSPLFLHSPAASGSTLNVPQLPRLSRQCLSVPLSSGYSDSVRSPRPIVQSLHPAPSLSSRSASSSSGHSSAASLPSRPVTPIRSSSRSSMIPGSVVPSANSFHVSRSRAVSSSSPPHETRLPVVIPHFPIPNTKFIPLLTGSGDWHSWHTCVQTAAVSSGVANHIFGPVYQDDLPFLDLPYESAERPSYPPPRVNISSLPHQVLEWDTWWAKDNVARFIITSRLSDTVAKSIDMGATFNVGRDRTARHIFADLFPDLWGW